ncbi:MAG TPA: hypothetical protein VM529_06905 [Gemmata sp.]|nr:hypothetical protein [Gemmata sp.]
MPSDKPSPDSVEAVRVEPLLPPTIYDSQRPLYELMVNSLRDLRRGYFSLPKVIPLTVMALALGTGIGVVLVLTVAWVVHWLHWSEWVIYTVIGLPVLTTIATVAMRKWELAHDMEVIESPSGERKLEFHRFEVALGRGFLIYVYSVGVLFGVHLQVIYQTSHHCGFDFAPSWPDSARIAATNLLDGISFDFTQVVGLSLGDRPNHTPQSAALFALFRFAYAGCVVILAFAIWMRRSIVHLARMYDRFLVNPTPAGLHDYLRAVCYRTKGWAKHYHDEFLFFCLVEKCLSKDYPGCRALHDLFPSQIVTEVYDLFRDGRDRPVFTPSTD